MKNADRLVTVALIYSGYTLICFVVASLYYFTATPAERANPPLIIEIAACSVGVYVVVGTLLMAKIFRKKEEEDPEEDEGEKSISGDEEA